MENSLLFMFIKKLQLKLKVYYEYSLTKKILHGNLKMIAVYAENSFFMKNFAKEDIRKMHNQSEIINTSETLINYFINKINLLIKKGFNGSKIINLIKCFDTGLINRKMCFALAFKESLTKQVFTKVFEFKIEE